MVSLLHRAAIKKSKTSQFTNFVLYFQFKNLISRLIKSKQKKSRELVLEELLDTAKARKLAYYGHTMRKQGNCLEKEIMQGTMPGARRRGRPRTAWIDNIKSWTGLSVEESIRMTEDRGKWRKYVHGMDVLG